MNNNLLTAIVFFKPGTKRPRKYRNIKNQLRFEGFVAAAGAYYVNYYDQAKNFVGRKWIKDFS